MKDVPNNFHKTTIYLFILPLLFVMGCTENFNSKQTEGTESIVYEKTGEKVFHLDSTMRFTNQSLVFFNDHGKPKLSIFNKMNASINYFNYETGVLEDKVFFEIEGPNGIGNISNMGHFQTTKDSIFLFNHWEQRVYLMNPKGKKIVSYDLVPPESKKDEIKYLGYYLMNSPNSPVFKQGNYLYINVVNSGQLKSEDGSLIFMIKLNLVTKEKEYLEINQQILFDEFWGPVTPFISTAIVHDNEIITSFAKNPMVSITDIENPQSVITEKEVGSKFIEEFKPFPKRNDEHPMYGYNYMDIASETNQAAFYLGLLHNPFENHFLRLALQKRTPEQYSLGKKGMQYSFIVTDEDLVTVGEFELPKGKYDLNMSLINEYGLHLANSEAYETNEDQLVFDIYSVKKKQATK